MDLLFQPWMRTVLVLILPCAVMFLIIRIILLNIALYNRRLEQHRRVVEEQRLAEAAERAAAIAEASSERICLGCGAHMAADQTFCQDCGTWAS
jgi:hypothetical protein